MVNLRRALLFTIPRILNSTANPTRIAIVDSSIQSQTLHRKFPSAFSRFFSSDKVNNSQDIDLSSKESKRRLVNRLIYRSKQRGYLELDLIMGDWVFHNIYCMDENEIKALIDVLNLENLDLWKWLTRQEQPPEEVEKNPVFFALRNDILRPLYTLASPETRAEFGQPWVRGWDDFKKGRDSPIVGNQ